MADSVWYFGYGSNMKSSIMSNRGITPLSTEVGIVPGYILTFDIFGIPYAEPSFASIARVSKPESISKELGPSLLGTEETRIPPVHGVLYLLKKEDYRRLVTSEGAGVGYDEIAVQAYILKSPNNGRMLAGVQIIAYTLKAKFPWRPNRGPSKRYMDLLLDGCEEHQLPPHYRRYLQSLPVYQGQAQGKPYFGRVGAFLFLTFWRSVIRLLAKATKVITDDRGHCPRWLGKAIVVIYNCMWLWHDHVHSRFWGGGDGRIVDYKGLELQ